MLKCLLKLRKAGTDIVCTGDLYRMMNGDENLVVPPHLDMEYLTITDRVIEEARNLGLEEDGEEQECLSIPKKLYN